MQQDGQQGEVDLTKKIHTHVPLHFTGNSGAVKELGGVLLRNMSEVEVEAFPQDLPKFIEISLDELQELNDAVRLKDIKVAETVSVLGNPEETVTIVKPPRTQEEIEALDEADVDTGAEPEEGEEGEEAAEGEEGEAEDAGEEDGEKAEGEESADAGEKGGDGKADEKKSK